MNIIFWIVFGLIAGAAANYLYPNPSKGGVLGSIALGVVGAIIGGYLGSNLLGVGVTGFNISSFIVAIIGALIALFIGRMLNKST